MSLAADYRRINKDPIIDLIRTRLQDKVGKGQKITGAIIKETAIGAGITPGTLRKWLYHGTRRPQQLTVRFVLEQLGVERRFIDAVSGKTIEGKF